MAPVTWSSRATAAEVERVEVFTLWSGFADPPTRAAKLTVANAAGRFVRESALEGDAGELPAAAVEDVLEALGRPPIPQLEPSLFDLPEEVIRGHYASIWTDDSPAHLVRITFADGRVVTIRADSQYAFMLPLKVEDSGGGSWETFDPVLGRALAGLMPAGYPDADRLAGNSSMLASDLEEYEWRQKEGSDESLVLSPPPDGEAGMFSDAAAAEAELWRIFSREESPEAAAEAEHAGQLSRRLLKRNSPETVRDLVARGADPSAADDVGQTALMHAAFPPFDADRFRLLAGAGADLEARRNDGLTGLQLACAGGEARAAAAWVEAGADVEARTPEGATPLMLGATWSAIVQSLLAAGADVKAADAEGHTALVYAIVRQSMIRAQDALETVRELLKAGADVNRRDRTSVTPLGHARRGLVGAELELEVLRVFNPGMKPRGYAGWDECRLAHAVITLLTTAGAKE
jgi:hypothetical protein